MTSLVEKYNQCGSENVKVVNEYNKRVKEINVLQQTIEEL